MASLTGQLVAETYKALLKVIDNDVLTASEKQITDGFGGGSNVFIDSQGFLRANKYKVTNGLATQFLKADGSLDSNAYLTSITGAQVITALGYTPVPTTRTITINGETHDLSANNSWTIAGTSAVWGNIAGILSNQTDLQNALNAKVPYTGATANVDLGENALLAEYLSIDTATTHVTDVGEIVWNAIDGTFDMGLLNGVVLQAGQELHFYGKATGVISNGQAVMFAGVEGDHLLMSLADAATINANPQYFIGIATQDFANNDFGYVTVLGKVRNLDTTAYSLGAVLYYDSTNAIDGKLTTTMPIAPNAKIEVAAVVRVHATQGSLMVRPHIMPKLNQIQDVYIADPANNHGLFYDLAGGYWKNTSIASALGYTPQAQLNGTGFVKASGTTISYDNSTYLSASDAASIYQRLDKMVSNLLPSATEYPNSNAVIAALALKADALNPVFTGYMTISGAEPKLYFTDTDQNPDYFIGADAGFFRIYDQTAGATRFVINSSGVTTIAGDLIVGTIAKSGGTASQFLKADGSIDSNSYVTSASLANYLLITTAASTYQRLDKMVSNLLPSDTEYPNSNAVLAKLALKADAANPVFTGNMTISGAEPKLFFVDTDNNPDYTVFIDSGFFYIYDQTAGATRFQINSSGNISTGVGKSITAGSFVRDGGTAAQFLKADGTIDSNSYALSSALGNYLPLTGGSLSGTLGGTIANFSAEIQSASYIQSKLGASATIGAGSRFQWDNAATGASQKQIAVQMNASNGLDFWFYNGSTYTNTGLKFNSDGSINAASATFTGALSGTSADFAGGVQGITATILGTSNGSPVLTLGTAGSINAVINTADEMFFNIDSNNNQTDARFVFGTNRSTSSGGIELVTFAENGNVLIGTSTNSGYKLDVNGSGRFSGILYASDNIRIYGANQFWFNSAFRGQIVNYGAYAGTTDWSPFFTSETSLAFGVNGNATKALNIATTGAVTFSNNVTIEGNASTIRNGNELRFNRPDNAIYTRMYDSGSLAANGFTFDNMNSEGFHFKNNGSTIMRMPSNGNVGIGTTSPDRRLRVASDGSNWISGVFGGSGGTDQVVVGNYNGRASIGGHNNALNGWAALSLNFDGGNVLIGTTTDSGYKLDVNGSLRINGVNPSITTDSATDYTIINARKNGTRTWQIDSVSGNFWLYMQGIGNYGFQLSGSTGAALFYSSVTATAFFESSDIRLKTLIESNPIIDGIEKLEAKLYEKNGKIELGYFAQDAEMFMPYAVTKNEDGFLNLSYREVHTAKIARLEQRVAELEKQLNLN